MHIYLAIKYYSDQKNRSQIEMLSALLNRLGVETTCIARDVEQSGRVTLPPAELMHRSFAAIERSDLVLIEFSEKGVGLGIEAGYAFARQIPILTIRRAGCPISATLQGISSGDLEYAELEDLEPALTRYIQGYRK